MKRYPDWPSRLSTYLANRVRQPHVTGENDCALFAAGAVEAMTGEDLTGGVRGYATYREGVRAAGALRLRDLADRALERVGPALARRGDVAWLVERGADGRLRAGFMIFDGAVLRGPGGASRPRRAAKLAWRVGW